MRIFIPLLVFAVTGCPSAPVPAVAPDGSPTSAPTAPTMDAPSPTPGPVAPTDPTPATSDPADHQVAYDRAKPAFEKHCAPCHTKGGYSSSEEAIEHFDMSTYPFGGHHAHEIAKTVRSSVGGAGKPATMPQGNTDALKADERAAIVAWADAFEKAGASKPHDHSGHDHKH